MSSQSCLETKTSIVGIDRERIYLTKCVPLERIDTFREEEGWYNAYVHGFTSPQEKMTYHEMIPTP